MIYLILAGIALSLLVLRWLINADPAALASGLRRAGIILLIGFFIYLLLTGRLAALIPLFIVLVPVAARFFNPSDPQGGNPFSNRSPQMTIEEAYDILDLKPGATTQEINDAHKKLMKKMHPDTGGTDYMAKKLNEARDLLLGKR